MRAGPARLGALVAALLLSVVGLSLGSRPAQAASADVIDSFSAEYIVNPSGVTSVTETIVWRFGSDSGRRGINRQYITREPFDDNQDAVYEYKNFRVSSPSGAPDQVEESTSEQGRLHSINLRIGDPDRRVSTPTATYTISYDIVGALRTNRGVDELYWDVTGFGNPRIRQAEIAVQVPKGVQETSCFQGPPGSTDTCAATIQDGKASYAVRDLAAGSGMSIGARIGAGLVADNSIHLVERGDRLTSAQKRTVGVAAGAAGLSAIGSPLIGWLVLRRRNVDRRFAGLPPGTMPAAGTSAQVVRNDPKLEIPVAFSPPHVPVAEGGFLIDKVTNTRETAATVVQLAVRGVLRIEAASESEVSATLVDPAKLEAPNETALVSVLFGGRPPGAVAQLSGRGELAAAHLAADAKVRQQVRARGWFVNQASARRARNVGIGSAFPILLVGYLATSLGSVGGYVLLAALAFVPMIITAVVVWRKLRRGQRTATGRAVCDQLEGFRTYLATAEANQIRFEEGEDIFSRYLPWAIVFGLADRWAGICRELVAAGRLPDVSPQWYGGTVPWTMFNYGMLSSSLANASLPMPSPSSAGTGFGGGSSFGGGGFSGGGGGGGGSSSW